MFGFVRVTAAVPKTAVSNIEANTEEIISFMEKAKTKGADVIVFPELCITGKHCGDLFFNSLLTDRSAEALERICKASEGITAVVGLPVRVKEKLFNCAALICNGRIAGIEPKRERSRQFFDSSENSLLEINGNTVPFGRYVYEYGSKGASLAICFDSELSGDKFGYADIIVCPASQCELAYSGDVLNTRLNLFSETNGVSLVYSSGGITESTNEKVYAGRSCVFENGRLLARGELFSKNGSLCIADVDTELLRSAKRQRSAKPEYPKVETVNLDFEPPFKSKLIRKISRNPFLPENSRDADLYFRDILNIQMAGLYKKLVHTGIKKSVLAISGGLDSTLALVSVVATYDYAGWPRENIIGISMPGFGTSGRTYANSLKLMRELGITARVISIKDACSVHFKDIGMPEGHRGVTFENVQARERTQVLMDVAGLENGLAVGTGDLSEAALGFCTYNGDQMSMYCVNGGIPKTMIPVLLRHAAENAFEEAGSILFDIIDTPISPELLPPNGIDEITQKTESILGPYELHDFFMYYALKYGFSPQKIAFIAKHAFAGVYEDNTIEATLNLFFRRFVNNQFKRRAAPEAPRVFDVSLSPVGGFEMSCDTDARLWTI